jgi:ParB family chromosome partitioning protein
VAEKKKPAPARKRAPRAKATPVAKGIPAAQTRDVPAAEVAPTVRAIEAAGGAVLAAYRDPFGGHPIVLAALPVDRVAPTPYQRDLSPMHVKRLEGALRALDRFLDPIVAVVAEGGGFWTPNGNHRLAAMRAMGAQAVTALVVPEAETAFKILALNTEKAHALRDKALEVIRMARALAPTGSRESEHAVEFEEPSFLTLGVCYEANGRFPGGAYQPILRRTEAFLEEPIERALAERERRAKRVMALEEAVAAAVAKLKERGLQSPYLRAFVIARVNPLRWSKEEHPDLDRTLDEMEKKVARFDATKISPQDVARSGGGSADAAEE